MIQRNLNRIIDANLNRAKEGLRVCEDVARFVWDDATLAQQIKMNRHLLTRALMLMGFKAILSARDIEGDVGRNTIATEKKRSTVSDIFFANCQRVKESLRVLEELAKLTSPKASQTFKKIRYAVYSIETQALKRC